MAKNKKEKFQQRSNNSQLYVIAGILIVIILGAAYFLTSKDTGTNQANIGGGNVPAASSGAQVQEVTITPTIEADKLIIKKSEVEQNKIVKFDYEPVKLTLKSGAKVPFPLLAFITPSGKLNVAVRMCEPCNGLSFSVIDGKILNCNTCGTQWDLETNQWNGVGAQSCGSYPPEIIKNIAVNGDNVEIKIADFKDWVPRV